MGIRRWERLRAARAADKQRIETALVVQSTTITRAQISDLEYATPIADVSGGDTVDTQARTTLNTLLAALRTQGILPT
jgi:hypothetical protein